LRESLAIKVLVVDDNQDYNELIAETLLSNGYETSSVYNGYEAEKVCAYFKPDLVITDIIMPEQDGIGLLTALQNQILDNGLKVLAVSGGGRVADSDYLTIAKNFGAQGTLEKPFSSAKLLTKVKSLHCDD